MTGGTDARSVHEVEVYDPEAGVWRLTDSMAQARSNHATVLLDDGRALVTGGIAWSEDRPLDDCELYDPVTGL